MAAAWESGPESRKHLSWPRTARPLFVRAARTLPGPAAAAAVRRTGVRGRGSAFPPGAADRSVRAGQPNGARVRAGGGGQGPAGGAALRRAAALGEKAQRQRGEEKDQADHFCLLERAQKSARPAGAADAALSIIYVRPFTICSPILQARSWTRPHVRAALSASPPSLKSRG